MFRNYKATSNFPTVNQARNANKKIESTEQTQTWSNRAIEHLQTANKPFLALTRQTGVQTSNIVKVGWQKINDLLLKAIKKDNTIIL